MGTARWQDGRLRYPAGAGRRRIRGAAPRKSKKQGTRGSRRARFFYCQRTGRQPAGRPGTARSGRTTGAHWPAFDQGSAGCGRRTGRHSACSHGTDRKSVVEGKSVSVRVDLGGRRIIKKKKTKENKKTYK